jgi:hypothetical protein
MAAILAARKLAQCFRVKSPGGYFRDLGCGAMGLRDHAGG